MRLFTCKSWMGSHLFIYDCDFVDGHISVIIPKKRNSMHVLQHKIRVGVEFNSDNQCVLVLLKIIITYSTFLNPTGIGQLERETCFLKCDHMDKNLYKLDYFFHTHSPVTWSSKLLFLDFRSFFIFNLGHVPDSPLQESWKAR